MAHGNSHSRHAAARRPPWGFGRRFERELTFSAPAPPERVFPLLCPVLEYDWIPDWTCVMHYSQSGVAEADAVFKTKHGLGKTAVWTTIVYDPPRRIEYLIVVGKKAVIRLAIGLEAEAGGSATRVTWLMRFTSISAFFAPLIAKEFSEANFRAMIDARTRQMALYFSGTGPQA